VLALALYDADPKVKVIDLSRNFGHHKAIMTGLSHAEGEFVFLIDVDLEEQPELIEEFWKEMEGEKDTDVVYGVQAGRKGGWLEQVSGTLFYKIFNYFSATKVPENVVTARLMSKAYVNALVSFREQEIFLAGLWISAGFRQKSLPVNKLSHSPTTYSFGKKMAVLVNAITSFTSRPLSHIFYLGVFISIGSFSYIVYMILRKLFFGTYLAGWTSLIASIWMVGGIVIFSIGTLGIYLSKIFTEVKNRPYTVIKRHYKRETKA
jgi:putative glycosyltransferase